MEGGLLVTQQECFCNFYDLLMLRDINFFKGYLIVQVLYDAYKLVNCCSGTVCDTLRLFGDFRQLRPIDGGRVMGMYLWSPEYSEADDDYIELAPAVYPALRCTLDVLDGKFVFTNVYNNAGAMNTTLRDIFGVSAQRIGWHDNYNATDTIVAVNFRIMCCLAEANQFPGHSGCDLLKTAHRDTYGLVHIPTRTVIKLRSRPIFGGNLNITPEVVETLLSPDGSTLAVVVKSTEAIRTPTRNHQVVVIDTATGKHEIAYCGSTGGDQVQGATPKLLYIEDAKAIVFQVFDAVFKQPCFNARVDAMANKLYGLFDCRLPMEITLQIAGYLG